MERIGFIVKKANPEAIALAERLAAYVGERGIESYADSDVVTAGGRLKPADSRFLSEKVDALVVLGGDGTMLYASRLAAGRRIPILGVNMGLLGFLTAVDEEEAEASLDKMIAGRYDLEERMLLNVAVYRGGERLVEHRVLNDAVIKGKRTRLLMLKAKVDGRYMTTYRADGLIVATPTGSTAYALSAGGPILYPTIQSILMVPISPFNLSKRPIVLPHSAEVEIEIMSNNMDVELTMDGQMDLPMKTADVVRIKKAAESVWFVKSATKSYFDLLRERLRWGR